MGTDPDPESGNPATSNTARSAGDEHGCVIPDNTRMAWMIELGIREIENGEGLGIYEAVAMIRRNLGLRRRPSDKTAPDHRTIALFDNVYK